MSYYDIDSILTDAQVQQHNPQFAIFRPKANPTIKKLPCTFELDVPGLGILEGNPGENVRLLSLRKRQVS
jgi:GINS complex subunit 3